MLNADIRNQAKTLGIHLWQVADKLGMQDSNFSRMLRKELPEKEKAHILKVIVQLKAEAEHES